MKVICLISPAPHSIHFVNRIHERFPVSLVVSEERRTAGRPLGRRLASLASPPALAAAIGDRLRARHRREVERRILGPRRIALDPDIEVLRVESVNAPEVADRLLAERPDVLADHGTSIVRAPVLETAEAALNLHWGLSPYYRGVRCTDWALINWDPLNIGVTIHELTRNIDGGPIWGQERAEVRATDSVHSLNMQLSRRGTDVTLRAIDALRRGKVPPARVQDRELGFLTLSRQWSPTLSRHIRRLESDDTIERMLKHPARPALPIVALDD